MILAKQRGILNRLSPEFFEVLLKEMIANLKKSA